MVRVRTSRARERLLKREWDCDKILRLESAVLSATGIWGNAMSVLSRKEF